MFCGAAIAWLALAAVAPGGAPGEPDAAVADAVLHHLQEARAAAGAPELVRLEALDRVALERARAIAALPESRRLGSKPPVDEALERHGVRRYRRAFEHIDLKRGYRDPGAAFAETWNAYGPGWSTATDPARGAVGLAALVAEDGYHVLVAVLLDELPPPPKPRDLERLALEAVNRIRTEHGRPALEDHPRLARVARAHSLDMRLSGFFDHLSPAGLAPADRVRGAGLAWRKVAENIQLNREDDPVRAAVEAWMASPDHRRNILDREFTHSGVGVAVDEHGRVWLTQLFLLPDPGAGRRRTRR